MNSVFRKRKPANGGSERGLFFRRDSKEFQIRGTLSLRGMRAASRGERKKNDR